MYLETIDEAATQECEVSIQLMGGNEKENLLQDGDSLPLELIDLHAKEKEVGVEKECKKMRQHMH